MPKTTPKKRTAIDWDAVRQQIEMTNQKLSGSEELSPEALEKAWARRAAQIAQKIEENEQGESIQVAIVSLDGELYGLDVQHIFDIRLLEHVTFVPRVPAWVLGVVNWRGRILSVINFRRFLGLPEAENKTRHPYLVVLQSGEMEVGIQIDIVFAIETIPLSRINKDDGVYSFKPEYVNGLFMWAPSSEQPQTVLFLNLPVLLTDPRLIVREELV